MPKNQFGVSGPAGPSTFNSIPKRVEIAAKHYRSIGSGCINVALPDLSLVFRAEAVDVNCPHSEMIADQ